MTAMKNAIYEIRGRFLAFILLVLYGVSVGEAAVILGVSDAVGAPGEKSQIDITLANDADVVALQFNLLLPSGVEVDGDPIYNPDRASGYKTMCRRTADGRYMLMCTSASNFPFEGRSGIVFSLPVIIRQGTQEGKALPVVISDAIAASPTGDNILTSMTDGTLTVAKSPDLKVYDVAISSSKVMPGENISVSWKVSNHGETPTHAGWSEELLLIDASGATHRMGVTNYSGTLSPGETVVRAAEPVVGQTPMIDGHCHLKVRLTPDKGCGEPGHLRSDNESLSPGTVEVGRRLLLSSEALTVEEGALNPTAVKVTRSGNLSGDLTLYLNGVDDERYSIPEYAVIPAGKTSIEIELDAVPNKKPDPNSVSTLNIGNEEEGYPYTSLTINTVDDTLPTLGLISSADSMSEGETLQMSITTDLVRDIDIPVTIVADRSSGVSFPASVVLPAGSREVSFSMFYPENDMIQGERDLTVIASAEGYDSEEHVIFLKDDDIPTLTLEISHPGLTEDAGVVAATATIRREGSTDKKLTLEITDDSRGRLFMASNRVSIPAGAKEATVMFGPVDNSDADGDLICTINAAVVIPGCSCSVGVHESAGRVSIPFEVYDDDGPRLTFGLPASYVKEGGVMEVTVARNTPVGAPLRVNLSVAPEGIVELPTVVEIPAGASRADVTVRALPNHTTDDAREVVITAVAESHSKASARLTVTDNTLPDATVKSFAFDAGQFFPADSVQARILVANTGSGVLASATPVEVYLRETGGVAAVSYTPRPLAPEETIELMLSVPIPGKVGRYHYLATVNHDRKIQELAYDNNTVMAEEIEVISPFSAKVKTDRRSYVSGDSIFITGSLVGRFKAGDKVEVYVINSGYRHAMSAELNAAGSFDTVYKPYYGQTGHFVAGACHPGEGSRDELTYFDIPAILKATTGHITHETTPGETVEGKLKLKNPAEIAVSGLDVRTESPSGISASVTLPSTEIAAEGSIEVDYRLMSDRITPGVDWEETMLVFSASNASTLRYPLYLFCRNPKGEIAADMGQIDVAVMKGASRTLSLTLVNRGAGETGAITPSMPSWMKISPSVLPSISGGGEVTLGLTMTPTGNVGGRHSGIIYFNCESGNSLGIPFSVEIASSGEGQLSVDVCDNLTYGTGLDPVGPHVAGADIILRNAATGAPVASGKSDGNGLWEATLPEGTYDMTVSESSHLPRTMKVSVEPGRRTEKTANILIRTVDISYSVDETEVDDMYEINIETKYQTNVPMPVVVIEQLDRVDGDNMYPGETKMIRLEVSNKGLMRAEEVTILLPKEVPGWTIIPAYNLTPFPLEAGENVIIPLMVTLNDANLKAPVNGPKYGPEDVERACFANYASTYKVICGTDMPEGGAYYRLALASCHQAAIYEDIFGGFGYFGTGTGGPVGGLIDWFLNDFLGVGSRPGNGSTNSFLDSYTELNSVINKTFCDHCTANLAAHFIDVLAENVPTHEFLDAAGAMFNAIYDVRRWYENIDDPELRQRVLDDLMNMLNQLAQSLENDNRDEGEEHFDQVMAGVQIVQSFGELAHRYFMTAEEARQDIECYASNQFGGSGSPDWLNSYEEATERLGEGCAQIHDFEREIFGDEIWTGRGRAGIDIFVEALSRRTPEGYLDLQSALDARPGFVTEEQVTALVERWNNTLFNLDPSSSNRIDLRTLQSAADDLENIENEAIEKGYQSTAHRYEAEIGNVKNILDLEEQAVCASVSLRFTQRMHMTRQAFRGTLTVNNGHTEKPVTDFRFYPSVQTPDGDNATSKEFQINMEGFTGFSGDIDNEDSGLNLDPGKEGTATMLYIPTRFAAPEEETPWNFGGTVSYVDPFSGDYTSMTLPFVTLGVRPSPLLTLDYFMQRDILGDDPLTEEMEPIEEAEFSLLVRNVGEGNASDVSITALAPEIVDNRKGLLVDFNLTGGEVDGEERVLPLDGNVSVPIGGIPANGHKVIRWWLTSSLLGHFTSYSAEYTHLTSYGNPDLSLVEGVNVHELVRSVVAPDGDTVFLVNEDIDSEDTPDRIFSPEGGKYYVDAADALFSMTGDDIGGLDVSSRNAGWVYCNVKDPTYGTRSLIRVVRKSDNREMSLRNFWQTDRTLRDGLEPLYENRIHFADSLTSGKETYHLYFGPKKAESLSVVEVTGLPENGITPGQLENLTLRLSRPIHENSNPADGITVMCGDDTVPKTAYSVISTGDAIVDVRFGESVNAKGLYTMTMDTSKLMDINGVSGESIQKYSWTVSGDNKLSIRCSADPVEGGEVECVVAPLFGEEAQYLAKETDGWNFSEWTFNGKSVGSNQLLSFQALLDGELVARFRRAVHMVDVLSAEGGFAEGNPGGYQHGTIAFFKAIPSDGYEFVKWTILSDNQDITEITDSSELELVVEKAVTIIPSFRRVIFTQTLNLTKGWNWISSALEIPQIPVKRFSEIIGNRVDDPSLCYGTMLKVHTNAPILLPLEGRDGFLTTQTLILDKGSNWIGHPYREEVDINTALSGCSEGDIIAGQRGFSELSGGLWHGDLSTLRPGEGYILYSVNGGMLRFSNVSGEFGAASIEVDPLAANHQRAMQLTLRPVDIHGTPYGIESGSVIKARSGDEERGMGTVYGDIFRLNIFGSAGERLLLELSSVSDDNEYNINKPMYAYVDFSEGPSGSTATPLEVVFDEYLGLDEVMAQYKTVTVYSLSGICLFKDVPVQKLSALSAGIYIVEGRLVRKD